MPGYSRIGFEQYPNWSLYDFNGSSYEIIEPSVLFENLFKYDKEKKTFYLKTIIICGTPGSGKSNFIRCLGLICRKIWGEKALVLSTNNPRILKDKRYIEYFRGYEVVLLIVDDAIRENLDSRTSLKKGNIKTSREFVVSRHTLENNFTWTKSGLLILVLATQQFGRIDKTIRENALIQIYTSFLNDPKWIQMFDEGYINLLKDSTKRSLIYSEEDAPHFALMKLITGDISMCQISYWDPDLIQIPYVEYKEEEDSFVIDILSKYLLKEFQDIQDVKKEKLWGFIESKKDKIETENNITIEDRHVRKAINLSFYKTDNPDEEPPFNKEVITDFVEKNCRFSKNAWIPKEILVDKINLELTKLKEKIVTTTRLTLFLKEKYNIQPGKKMVDRKYFFVYFGLELIKNSP